MSHTVIFTLPHSLIISGESGVGPAVNSVAWAPSCGRRHHLIATGGRDGRVKIWKVLPPEENNRLTSEWVVNCTGTFDEHQYVHLLFVRYTLVYFWLRVLSCH